MGFLDKAKSTIKKATKNIGEETVNVVDYDEVYEKQEKAKKQRSPKKKAPAEELEPVDYNNGLEPEEEYYEYDHEDDNRMSSHEDIPMVEETAFDIDISETEDFISEKQEVERSERHPDKKGKEEVVKDILEVLNIPITFEIESDVYLPEDLKDISFDLQVPQGYEIGEVNTFVSRVKVSINRLVDLLKQRNEHVAKLASMVDRLQVDVNNMKFQNEVANGINVMPTSSSESEDVENENFELRLAVKRLQEELDSVYRENENSSASNGELSESQREQFDELQDELSIAQRENEELRDEIYDLKNQNAILIENQDMLEEQQYDQQYDYDQSNNQSAYDFDDANSNEVAYEEDEELELPQEELANLSSYGNDSHIPDPDQNSLFYDEDSESTDDFLLNNAEYYDRDLSENPQNDDFFVYDNDDDNNNENNNTYETETDGNFTYYEDDDSDDVLNNLQDWKNK